MTRPKEEDKLENKSARETYQLNLSLADTWLLVHDLPTGKPSVHSRTAKWRKERKKEPRVYLSCPVHLSERLVRSFVPRDIFRRLTTFHILCSFYDIAVL